MQAILCSIFFSRAVQIFVQHYRTNSAWKKWSRGNYLCFNINQEGRNNYGAALNNIIISEINEQEGVLLLQNSCWSADRYVVANLAVWNSSTRE